MVKTLLELIGAGLCNNHQFQQSALFEYSDTSPSQYRRLERSCGEKLHQVHVCLLLISVRLLLMQDDVLQGTLIGSCDFQLTQLLNSNQPRASFLLSYVATLKNLKNVVCTVQAIICSVCSPSDQGPSAKVIVLGWKNEMSEAAGVSFSIQ